MDMKLHIDMMVNQLAFGAVAALEIFAEIRKQNKISSKSLLDIKKVAEKVSDIINSKDSLKKDVRDSVGFDLGRLSVAVPLELIQADETENAKAMEIACFAIEHFLNIKNLAS